MAVAQAEIDRNNPALGIGFVLLGMLLISINDTLMKLLSGGYPLHQMVFVRSAIGICFSVMLVQLEGGWRILRTATPGLHLIRCLFVVVANMMFFTALAVMPLPNVTAVFFVGPLFITLLSIPILGERVGIRRLAAVLVGFLGVLIMVRPGSDLAASASHPLVLLLPVAAAFCYAMMSVLTRRLGIASKASAMAIYIQATFLGVGALFWLVAGDGRFAEGLEEESLIFLLRAWVWPRAEDIWLFVLLGVNSAGIGYSLSRAYMSADAAVVAPFEYAALPLAVLWGWAIWGDMPSAGTWLGIAFVAGAGIYVFARERAKKRLAAGRAPARRW